MSSTSEIDMEEADAVHHRILEMQARRPIHVDLVVMSEVDREQSYDDDNKHLANHGGRRNLSSDAQAVLAVGSPSSSTRSTATTTPRNDKSSSPAKSNGVSTGGTNGEHEEESFGFDIVFFRRFYRLHGLLFLSCTSLSTLLFAFLISICLLQEYIVYRVGLIASGFYKVLADRDVSGFQTQTYTSLGIILAVAFTKSTNQYVQKVLTVTWRQLLCKAVHRLYFADIRYYQLNVLDKSIDNPDQRMTQDIDKFCTTYCEILPKLIISPFVISYYCYQAYDRSGWQGPLGCFCFFFVSTIVNKIIMTPIVQYVVKQEQCEGNFRFIHMLVRVNSESIAFLNASGIEADKTNESLDKLIQTQHRLYFRQFFLNFSVNMFDYLGSIFSYLMLAIPIFSGRYDDLTPAELSAVISQNSFVLIYLIYTFSSLVDTSGKFTDIAGVVHRISQLIEKLNALGDFWNDLFPDDYDQRTASSLELYGEWSNRRRDAGRDGDDSLDDKAKRNSHSSRLLPAIMLKDVTFSPPMCEKPLIVNLTMSFSAGESILIIGHSGYGKSSLLRILRGLWPHTEGTIRKFYPPGPQGVLYCPQKPYLTIGTLRDQACFPLKSGCSSAQEDNLIIHYLSLLKLKSLLERVGGLDVVVSWNLLDSLSPGEMQRLSFVRIFFHRPLIAILDEATSALPLEMESLIYLECQRLGITTISVGHRASLRQFHDKLLTIARNGGWTLEPIVPI
ncbi:ATP-binding cassette sub-family D member 4 [Folsomia candida]|uniref:ATP-binding cassette sub-family D member 4 n=1 Tax=Folsomia candida TaxID=158441 RepID=A0A226EYM6_FOLCA|nr:ATP-binding cassette sub-family D member 4 [Folsomia candida]